MCREVSTVVVVEPKFVRVTNGNVGVCSRERFMAGPRQGKGWLLLKSPKLPMV